MLRQQISGQTSDFNRIHMIMKYMLLTVCRLRLPSQMSNDHKYSDSKFSAATIKSLCKLRIVFERE